MNKEELKEITGGQAISDEEIKIIAKIKESIESIERGEKTYSMDEIKERYKNYFGK